MSIAARKFQRAAGSLSLGINLMIGKVFTANLSDSTSETGNPIANMTDQNPVTRWISNPGDPVIATVDLESVYLLKDIVINWAGDTIKNYTLAVSLDGNTWSTITTGVTNNTTPLLVNYNSFSALPRGRYSQITGTDRWNTGYGNSIWEVAAYGIIDTSVPVGTITGFSTGSITQTSIGLTWAYSGATLTNYTLKRAGTTIANPAAGATSYTDTGLAADNNYTYTLVGNYSAGGSSNTVTFTALTAGSQITNVPNISGMTAAQANSALTGVGLVGSHTSTDLYSSSVAAGRVLSQSPASGTNVQNGSTVTYALSLGASGSAGTWFSGQSNTNYPADPSFASWRGRAIEIAGSWASATDASSQHDSANWAFGPGAPYANISRIDFAAGGPLSGETWEQAAAGNFDSRWASNLAFMKTQWGSRNATDFYIRFCHEFNGNWYTWQVNDADIANFKTAWIRYYNLIQANFPGAKLVWCPNAGTVGHSYNVLQTGANELWPGDTYVDVVGIDSYNNFPWVNSQSAWNAKIVSENGIETFRQFAQLHGKPMSINEWANASVDNGGGGGDAPFFFQYYHDWLVTNGGTGAGNVLYEVLFNVPGYGDHYEMYTGSPNPYEPQSIAKYINLWSS